MVLLLLSDVTSAALLSALWLGGFVFIWWLMRVRIQALEGRILALAQSVEGLRRGLDGRATPHPSSEVRVPASSPDIERALAAMEGVRAGSETLAAEVAGIGQRVAALESGLASRFRELGSALGRTPSGMEPLEGRLRERFAARGFTTLRLIGDVSAISDAPTRVPLEAVKGGVTYKGFVVVEGGQVVDEKLTSAHDVFP